jgi:hypothetical protein
MISIKFAVSPFFAFEKPIKSVFVQSFNSIKKSMIFLFSYNKNNLPFSLSQWLGPNPGTVIYPCAWLNILSRIKTFTTMTCKVSKCKRLQKIQLIYVFAQTLRDFLLRFTLFDQILLKLIKILTHLCVVLLILTNFTVQVFANLQTIL